MGCCCSNRIGWDGNFDNYSVFQERLGFDSMGCNDFTKMMIQLTQNDESQVKLQKFGEFFSSYEFGKKVLEGLDSQINKVLSYEKFDYNGQLGSAFIFLLGLFYSKGNSKSKASCIFKYFDRKNTGSLPRADIKEIFHFFFELSVIIIPAVYEDKSFAQFKAASKAGIQKLDEKAMKIIGKTPLNIQLDEFFSKMTTDLKIVFQPAAIRKEIERANSKETPTPI